MSNIDKAIGIYQTYSLAKISALSKQSLIAQYAQCEQIGKLEQSLRRELQSINRANQRILENQIKEAKRAESIRYYRSIAHNCKECIILIQEQQDPYSILFLIELFKEPIKMLLHEAKSNLEEISDLDYCAHWLKQLNSIEQSLSQYEKDYLKSPFHVMIVENQPYLSKLDDLENERKILEKMSILYFPHLFVR